MQAWGGCRASPPSLPVVPTVMHLPTASNPFFPCLRSRPSTRPLQRLLNLIPADRVHVMERGRIVASGGMDLVDRLERGGYGTLSSSASTT